MAEEKKKINEDLLSSYESFFPKTTQCSSIENVYIYIKKTHTDKRIYIYTQNRDKNVSKTDHIYRQTPADVFATDSLSALHNFTAHQSVRLKNL